MSRNDCAMFKVFLKNNDVTEVKKFVIEGDTSVITNFFFMKEKLQTLFPKLRDTGFKLTWRDAEGDDILLENDEDLILAFTEMDGSLKTLYVTVSKDQFENNPPQFMNTSNGVICDVCNKDITSYRYKCLQCFDYDLCTDCEHAGHHSHHMMLRTSTPELPFARCGRKIFDQVNKAVRKANHMAYKECKRRTKWEKKKCDQDDCAGEGPSTKDPPCQSCPFEEYMPHIYPFIGAFNNLASQAATAAANAATSTAGAAASTQASAPTESGPESSAQTKSGEENAATQFMEAVRTALSAFVIPQQPQTPNHSQNGQTPQENGSGKPAQSSAASESGIDLTRSPQADEPMDVSTIQREAGWTILSNEEHTPQPHYPVLTPTLATPPQSIQAPLHPQVPLHPQAPLHPPAPQAHQAPTQPPQHPNYTSSYPNFFSQMFPPRTQNQDPKIAVGLSQLMEMGFSDEQALIALLKRYNGNVDQVIKHIFENK